jgi:hypothetical protein
MQILREASLFALLSLALTFVPLIMAVSYAVRPSEQRLALMRPLSLAGLFAALAGCVLGFINVLRYIGVTRELSPEAYGVIAIGAAEALVPLFVGFGTLTAAWLLVAARMGRQRD